MTRKVSSCEYSQKGPRVVNAKISSSLGDQRAVRLTIKFRWMPNENARATFCDRRGPRDLLSGQTYGH